MSTGKSIEAFTIRVYGLLMHNGQILLSRENIYGGVYLKFPGGGLEFGEGTLECLRREFQEECQLNIQVDDHFYTTEDFVPSAFSNRMQVLSIYYKVSCTDLSPLLHRSDREALNQHGDQELIWKSIDELNPNELNLPIDRLVAQRLLAE
ncbi:NUDIX domain-containing protein [Croceimicrobium sp.]|uniref:NUDIX domain-containing protein n=1 Tax=Croceimicrobium sp. TaxID=2828340 RepID=UPI003BACA978